jgi:hypothetical protein
VVTCTVEDLAGKRAEKSFTITVQDNTAPAVQITKAADKKAVEIAKVPLFQDCDQLSLLIFVQLTAMDNLCTPTYMCTYTHTHTSLHYHVMIIDK